MSRAEKEFLDLFSLKVINTTREHFNKYNILTKEAYLQIEYDTSKEVLKILKGGK